MQSARPGSPWKCTALQQQRPALQGGAGGGWKGVGTLSIQRSQTNSLWAGLEAAPHSRKRSLSWKYRQSLLAPRVAAKEGLGFRV